MADEPKLVEVTISHGAGGSVDIVDYGKIKSNYSTFKSKKYVFPEGWTEDEIEAFVEERRAALRDEIDALADREFEERFDQSYLSEN